MSALAEKAENINRILVTKEFNHAGAYQIRLCRAGQWHCVLIDDVLPTNGLSCLAYLKAARRSLWGPLIEKAAAKLHGSYEALNGGSFAEAFGMLTGCPVQRIVLSRYREPPPAPPGASQEVQAAHSKLVQKWRSKKLDMETLYAQLYSFKVLLLLRWRSCLLSQYVGHSSLNSVPAPTASAPATAPAATHFAATTYHNAAAAPPAMLLDGTVLLLLRCQSRRRGEATMTASPPHPPHEITTSSPSAR